MKCVSRYDVFRHLHSKKIGFYCFVHIDIGSIAKGAFYRDGKKMNDVLPRDRGIAMVFQNYALYPHMTVEKNISYELKNMKVPADEIKRKTDWAINILGLEEYRNRKPKNLSGGQRQSDR